MIHISYPQASHSEGVDACNPDGVAFVVINHLIGAVVKSRYLAEQLTVEVLSTLMMAWFVAVSTYANLYAVAF
jgi:hypothetical protein